MSCDMIDFPFDAGEDDRDMRSMSNTIDSAILGIKLDLEKISIFQNAIQCQDSQSIQDSLDRICEICETGWTECSGRIHRDSMDRLTAQDQKMIHLPQWISRMEDSTA